MDPIPSAAADPLAGAPSQRRLQRLPDFTGGRLCHFRQVFLRHGLPGLVLVPLLLLHEGPRWVGARVLQPVLDAPLRYAIGAVAILVVLCAVALVRDRRLDGAQLGWTLYLGALSAWEEFVFRVGLPIMLMLAGMDGVAAVIGANVLFGVMHWFTLRWRAAWCLVACLGGLALARLLDQRGDLALVIAAHWVGTFLNTPRPPRGVAP
ncbi:MAG TPA: CPBP family glutamic-type intramembrane protease [Pseudomonadales bacterium]|nr:CPBP family glutamic-type intramembrane protease [Pseudomonadales bacterium]